MTFFSGNPPRGFPSGHFFQHFHPKLKQMLAMIREFLPWFVVEYTSIDLLQFTLLPHKKVADVVHVSDIKKKTKFGGYSFVEVKFYRKKLLCLTRAMFFKSVGQEDFKYIYK